MSICGRSIKTQAYLADPSHIYRMLIGRRDLKGFLIDPAQSQRSAQLTDITSSPERDPHGLAHTKASTFAEHNKKPETVDQLPEILIRIARLVMREITAERFESPRQMSKDLAGSNAGGQGNCPNSGLYRRFGNISDDTKEPFFPVKGCSQ